MDQEIRFCTASDGVRISYATMGEGPPLVKAANYLTHLEYDRQSPVWRHWLYNNSINRHIMITFGTFAVQVLSLILKIKFSGWLTPMGVKPCNRQFAEDVEKFKDTLDTYFSRSHSPGSTYGCI